MEGCGGCGGAGGCWVESSVWRQGWRSRCGGGWLGRGAGAGGDPTVPPHPRQWRRGAVPELRSRRQQQQRAASPRGRERQETAPPREPVGTFVRVGEGGLEGWSWDVVVSISAMLFSEVRIRFGDETGSMLIYVLLQRPCSMGLFLRILGSSSGFRSKPSTPIVPMTTLTYLESCLDIMFGILVLVARVNHARIM